IFGGHTHMVVVEGVPKGVVDHGIDEYLIVHSCAPTRFVYEEGSAGHGFRTAGKDDVRISRLNHLSGEGNRAQTGSADLVDGHSGKGDGATGADDDLTRHILAESRLNNIADDGFIDIFRLN